MQNNKNKEFGHYVQRLIQKESFSYEEMYNAFSIMLLNETTEMQQGAFLAALCAKGETATEISAALNAIYEIDTVKLASKVTGVVVDNSGTGMDSFKTFNISTAASIVAATAGVKMARHGARAISSKCGTVDIAEALGVDVECTPSVVCKSIESCNIGLFNGMSSLVHEEALGRILSQINFGSTLNISGSLANPVLPKYAVRGVYSDKLLNITAEVMQNVGYKRAIVLNGCICENNLYVDEALVCGVTKCVEIFENGDITQYELTPSDFDIPFYDYKLLKANDLNTEKELFIKTIAGLGEKARIDAVALNAALVIYIAGIEHCKYKAFKLAKDIIYSKKCINTLSQWVGAQNREPERGLNVLNNLLTKVGL